MHKGASSQTRRIDRADRVRGSAVSRRGRGRRIGLALAGSAAALALCAPALAQEVPGTPAPTREEIERAPLRPPVQAPPRLTVEGDGIERAPCALAGEAFRDVTFTVNSVMFEDLREVDPETLRPSYAEFIGTTQPVAVVCEIRDRAATILRQAGYIAAVEVPEQRIADGTVRFQVLMAKLVGIRVRGDAGNAERTIAAYLERLTGREAFNRFEAERYLLLAGDLPGYDVRLSLRSANAGRGEVIGEVAVLRSPGQIDFNVQNYGSKALGRWGALLRGQFYGLTGLGDRTTIALFSTLDFEEQQTLQLGHDFRIGSEGLTLSGQFTYAWARPDVAGAAFEDLEARTLLATVEASYPFIRAQAETLRGAIGLDVVDQNVDLTDDVRLSRDRLRVAFIRLDLEATDPLSLTGIRGFTAAEPRWRGSGGIEVRQGIDILGGSEECGPGFVDCVKVGGEPISRFDADTTATVLRMEAFGEYRPVPNITFMLGARGQFSGDSLLSFEEFSAGNYSVGRGYDPGSLIGDRGVGLQAEIRFGSIVPRAIDAFSFQPYLFVDHAQVWNENVEARRQNLTSVGAGVRALYGDRAQLDVLLAVPLERVGLDPERPDPRLLISLTTRLWPWSF